MTAAVTAARISADPHRDDSPLAYRPILLPAPDESNARLSTHNDPLGAGQRTVTDPPALMPNGGYMCTCST